MVMLFPRLALALMSVMLSLTPFLSSLLYSIFGLEWNNIQSAILVFPFFIFSKWIGANIVSDLSTVVLFHIWPKYTKIKWDCLGMHEILGFYLTLEKRIVWFLGRGEGVEVVNYWPLSHFKVELHENQMRSLARLGLAWTGVPVP